MNKQVAFKESFDNVNLRTRALPKKLFLSLK